MDMTTRGRNTGIDTGEGLTESTESPLLFIQFQLATRRQTEPDPRPPLPIPILHRKMMHTHTINLSLRHASSASALWHEIVSYYGTASGCSAAQELACLSCI